MEGLGVFNAILDIVATIAGLAALVKGSRLWLKSEETPIWADAIIFLVFAGILLG